MEIDSDSDNGSDDAPLPILAVQTSAKQTNTQTQRNRTKVWSKVQTDSCRRSSKRQFRQQRQRQRRLESDFIFNLRISREFSEFNSACSSLSEISRTEYVRQRQNLKKKF